MASIPKTSSHISPISITLSASPSGLRSLLAKYLYFHSASVLIDRQCDKPVELHQSAGNPRPGLQLHGHRYRFHGRGYLGSSLLRIRFVYSCYAAFPSLVSLMELTQVLHTAETRLPSLLAPMDSRLPSELTTSTRGMILYIDRHYSLWHKSERCLPSLTVFICICASQTRYPTSFKFSFVLITPFFPAARRASILAAFTPGYCLNNVAGTHPRCMCRVSISHHN
jgi:hypothetical protein